MKKLKDAMDFHASNEKSWPLVLSSSMLRDIFRMYDEITLENQRGIKREDAVIDMMNFVSALIERIDLHTEFRALAFSGFPTMNITVKMDSKVESSQNNLPAITTLTSFNPVESVRVTHDTERLKFLSQPKSSHISTPSHKSEEIKNE